MENKQLKLAKDTIAKDFLHSDWESLYIHYQEIEISISDEIINKVAIEYHRLMSEWVLEQIESKQYQYIDILRKEVVNIHDVRNIFAENGIKLEPKF